MGWRDRDWAKFDEDEWSSLVRAPAPRPKRARPRVATATASTSLFVAVAVSGVLALAIHLAHGNALPVGPAPPVPKKRVVVVHWREADVLPAATAGRICITPRGRGRVCASYARGEKPADVLTRELRLFGLDVLSSG